MTVLATEVESWLAWHAGVEHDRAGEHGSLAASALHWLQVVPRPLAGLPGEWFTIDGVPVVTLPPGESLVFPDGRERSGVVRFDGIPLDHSVFPIWRGVAIEVGERAGELIVRPRRPDAPARVAYGGTATFDYDPRFVVRATFEPSPGREIVAESVASRVRHRIAVAGRARFVLDGREVAATLFRHKDGEKFRLLYRDLTGGELTYWASRNLIVDPDSGSHEGELVLDFNRSWNLPCAYGPYWTCALPPSENSLPVRIEAGELAPGRAAP